MPFGKVSGGLSHWHCGFLPAAWLAVERHTELASLSVQRLKDSKMPAIPLNNQDTGQLKLARYSSKMAGVQLAVEMDHKTSAPEWGHHGTGIPTIGSEERGQVKLIQPEMKQVKSLPHFSLCGQCHLLF